MPEELKRRESRLKRLREAKARLETEARKARARALREQADGMEATAAIHDDARVRKGLRTKAAKRRARAGELDPPEESPAGAGSQPVPERCRARRRRRRPGGCRQFSFWGLEAAGAEWALVCLCHNLLKMFRNRKRPRPARPGALPRPRRAKNGPKRLRYGSAYSSGAFQDPPASSSGARTPQIDTETGRNPRT